MYGSRGVDKLQSQGAYTARMVATFIVCSFCDTSSVQSLTDDQGEIGVLTSKDMDSFASIFLDFQALGKTQDPFGRFFSPPCMLNALILNSFDREGRTYRKTCSMAAASVQRQVKSRH